MCSKPARPQGRGTSAAVLLGGPNACRTTAPAVSAMSSVAAIARSAFQNRRRRRQLVASASARAITRPLERRIGPPKVQATIEQRQRAWSESSTRSSTTACSNDLDARTGRGATYGREHAGTSRFGTAHRIERHSRPVARARSASSATRRPGWPCGAASTASDSLEARQEPLPDGQARGHLDPGSRPSSGGVTLRPLDVAVPRDELDGSDQGERLVYSWSSANARPTTVSRVSRPS